MFLEHYVGIFSQNAQLKFSQKSMFMWRSSILHVFEAFSSEFIPSIKILIIIFELVCEEDKAEMPRNVQ